MVKKRTIGACVAGALLTPSGVALAQSDDGDPRVRPVVNRAILGAEGLAAEADAAQHKRLVRRHLGVARQYADLKDIELNERSLGAAHLANPSREVRRDTLELREDMQRIEERRAERREAREALEARWAAASSATAASSSGGGGSTATAGSSGGGGSAPTGGSSGGGASAGLESVAACESGGDPTAVSPGGQYRGKYQFDRQTWQSVGGAGDPAAAPEAEQDRRAAQLQAQQGSSPWPACGG